MMIGTDVEIGNNSKVQNNVSVYENVIVEDDVFIGPSAVFTNIKTPRAFIDRKTEFETTHIRQGASVGANATIVCGISLGQYCLIGAGAVVTKSVPDFALYLGVPARQTGWGKAGWSWLSLTCPLMAQNMKLLMINCFSKNNEILIDVFFLKSYRLIDDILIAAFRPFL